MVSDGSVGAIGGGASWVVTGSVVGTGAVVGAMKWPTVIVIVVPGFAVSPGPGVCVADSDRTALCC